MRFRSWPRTKPYRDTSRKRAAFERKQRFEREKTLLDGGLFSGELNPQCLKLK